MNRPDLHYWRDDANRRLRRRRQAGIATRILVVLALVGGLGTGLFFGGTALARELLSRDSCCVKRVEVDGTVHRDPRRLAERLADFVGEPLLFLDITDVRRAIERDPWVARASVSRVWPCVLRVTVEEREPAAVALVADTPWLVADDGTTLMRHGPGGPVLDLPVLTGISDDADLGQMDVERGLATLEAMTEEVPTLARRISSLDVSEATRTIVHLSGVSFPLWLDPEQPGRNLRSWNALRQVMNRDVAPARVDLRWRGRVAVLPRLEN